MVNVRAIAVLALYVAAPSFADDVISVSASLSEERVLTGDAVTLEINVVSQSQEAIEISLPRLEGLTELSRSKSEGTSIQWTGAGQRVTREYTVTIELQADKAGKLTIPPITARAGKNRGSSSELELSVGASEELNQTASTPEPDRIAPPERGEERLFMRYKVDKATAYVGEQIILDLDVYALPSMNFSIDDAPQLPALDGFWKETLDQPRQLTRRIESIQGKSYHAYRVWRIAIFPLDAGEKTIAQASATFGVNRSIFGGGQRERRKAPAIKLEILPLPSEGRPGNFSAQNVGVYTLEAKLDNEKVPAGKALVLSLTLNGRGNLKSVRLPDLSEVPGFRVFPPTVTDAIEIDGTGIHGSKRAEILLMPERGGRLEVPSVEMTIFNPVEKRYQRLETGSKRVVVEGEPSNTNGETFAATQTPDNETRLEPVKKPSLRPLRYRSQLTAAPIPPWKNPVFVGLFFLPPVLFVAARILSSMLALSRRETEGSRRRAKTKQARERLSKARKAVDAGDTANAYREMREALLDFASEQSGVSLRGMTIEEARAALAALGAKESLLSGYVREMEAADYAAFAPQALDRGALEGAADRWETLFTELETFTPREVSR